MQKVLLASAAAAAVFAISSPALADFWIVRDRPTGECRIVETKPADTKIIIVGNKVYKTRDEATREITTICTK